MKGLQNGFGRNRLSMDNLRMNKIEITLIAIFLVMSIPLNPEYAPQIATSTLLLVVLNLTKFLDSASDGIDL